MREYRTVKVSQINTGSRYIEMSDVDLQDLVDDIVANGLQVPILVDENLNLVDGYRRLQAFGPNDEVDVVVSNNYITTMEIMVADSKRPGTRTWTPRRLWEFHKATTKQRYTHHRFAASIHLDEVRKGSKNTGRTQARRESTKTLKQHLGTKSKVSLSRDIFAAISGYAASAIQAGTFVYARAEGAVSAPKEIRELAVDLVKRMDNGEMGVYAARHLLSALQKQGEAQISSEKEQRNILRNAAASVAATSKILLDIAAISDGISVEEAKEWAGIFAKARHDIFEVQKKLTERTKRG